MMIAKKESGLEEWKREPLTPSESICGMGSFPCERKNAHIREKTQHAMNNNNVTEVAFRYLQNKEGQKFTSIEAILAAILLVLTVWRFLSELQSEEFVNVSENY
jgi:hypothetical protein